MLVVQPNIAFGPDPTSLPHDWARLADWLGLPPAPELGEELIRRYAEPHRAYHTTAHLAVVLALLPELGGGSWLELAAWFHDAVYDPARPDNETQSAALARRELQAWGLPPDAVAFVEAAVLATADHLAADARFAPLLDADLAILAAPAPVYRAYLRGIRKEFRAVPAADFAAGRRAFVAELLGRRRLFATPAARVRFEAAARGNLQAELLSVSR